MSADEVRQFIDEVNRRFGAAAARKDFAGMAAFYTEDAKLLPPDVPIVSGRKAIEEFWRSAANVLGLTGVTLETVDLEFIQLHKAHPRPVHVLEPPAVPNDLSAL